MSSKELFKLLCLQFEQETSIHLGLINICPWMFSSRTVCNHRYAAILPYMLYVNLKGIEIIFHS